MKPETLEKIISKNEELIRQYFRDSRQKVMSVNPWFKDILGIEIKSDEEIRKENIPYRALLEKSSGMNFTTVAREIFVDRLNQELDEQLFETILDQKLMYLRQHIWLYRGLESFDTLSQQELEIYYNKIFSNTVSEIYLQKYREQLIGWVDLVDKDKALFVDCLMGIGKTNSIKMALAKRGNLSAVVFFPTNKLCLDFVKDLKRRIAEMNPSTLDKQDTGVEIYEDAIDENGEPITDDVAGHPVTRFSREFLQHEIYFVDGINKTECLHYNEIIGNYRLNWFKKKVVCQKCSKFKEGSCRFLKHDQLAPQSRIIVTTHKQYDRFYHNKKLHKWVVDGKKRNRDLFIIDEDIVLSQMYNPTSLTSEEIEDFVTTITGFLNEFSDTKEIRSKIDLLHSQLRKKYQKTSIIRAIDPDFKIPSEIKDAWQKASSDLTQLIPDHLDLSTTVANYIDMIEHGVRYGATVEAWGKRLRFHLPNPKSYDLSKVPPHVFFDGTMLDDKFLSKKLKNIKFERFKIEVRIPWKFRIYQNTNTDLPMTKLNEDKNNVMDFVARVFRGVPDTKNIFIITTKTIRSEYLEKFVMENYSHRNVIIAHYGDLRGVNKAEKCTVCLMLGSFTQSDSVEIAMALEFLTTDVLSKDITVCEGNLWKMKEKNYVRVYNDKFAVIGEMAKAFRHSEHRQALARTRYVNHDVDFYILSKDLVSDYDPFLPKAETTQYMNDIFKSRPPRPDRKFEEVKAATLEIIKEKEFALEMDVFRKTGISRRIIRKHLNELLENGTLSRKVTKYILAL